MPDTLPDSKYQDALGPSKLYGFYRGKVLQHLRDGRCKIFVPGAYPEKFSGQPAALPPAEQASPIFGGSCQGKGVFTYPNLNSIVWVFFQNGDQNLPVYFAACQGGKEAASHWNEVRPDVTEETVANGKDAYIHKIDAQNSTIKMWESGYVEIESKADPTGKMATKIVMDGKGSIIVSSTQQVQVSSPAINVFAEDTFQVTAPQIKLKANTRMDVETPVYSNICGVACNIVSPAVNIDAEQGSAVIKGRAHNYYMY